MPQASATLTYSAAQVVYVGSDEAEFARRAEAVGRAPDELRTNGVAGTVEEAIDRIGQLADIGVTRTYLQFLDLGDTDHARLVASEVLPKV